MSIRWAALPLAVLTTASLSAPVDLAIDLSRIGHISPKGRVQDSEYNRLPIVNSLIQMGSAAIPVLVGKLEDDTKIRDEVLDLWPEVKVGDVALVILCDLFATVDWKGSTVPGFTWNEILERTNARTPAWTVLQEFLVRHGRTELRQRVEALLKPYEGHLVWDASERCFKPIK